MMQLTPLAVKSHNLSPAGRGQAMWWVVTVMVAQVTGGPCRRHRAAGGVASGAVRKLPAQPTGCRSRQGNRTPVNSTLIRLIEPSDAPVLAGLLSRDKQAYARWLPSRPAEFYTPDGQASVIASL